MASHATSLEKALENLKCCFEQLSDPRIDWQKAHPLINILLMSICAVLCGAHHWREVENFARAKRSFFERILNLAIGIVSHDTFGRLFSLIDSEIFGQCFTDWVKSCFEIPPGASFNVDGKNSRGSHDRAKPAKEEHQTIEKGHGRIETRTISVIQGLEWLECEEEWRDLKCIVRISSKRE